MLFLLLLLLLAAVLASAAIANRKSAIPGALHLPTFPIVGHAFLVQNNPARAFMEWSKKYNRPSFVIRLGTTPVLVVNSHRHASELWIRHSSATGSRPVFHTFHNVVSATQGFTVGSTPAGASCQRKKKCIGKQLSPQTVGSDWAARIVNRQSAKTVQHLLRKSMARFGCRTPYDDWSLLRHAQYFVLGCALEYTYGIRLEAYGIHHDLANAVVETENKIIRLRSPLANYQDYLPGVRNFAFSTKAEMAAKSRDQYMDEFFRVFQRNLQKNHPEAVSCLLGRVFTQPGRLSLAETKSICLTMVSAGLDNIALSFDHLMGHLATPKGYKMQDRLFKELIKIYQNSSAAWDAVACENTSTYALALIHETMRFFTVLPLSLPRETTKDVLFDGMLIPSGTILLMNAFAADHDEEVFEKPYEFMPERWIDENGKIVDEKYLRHFGFGAGSRKCSGIALAVKEFYVLLCRMVLVFHIKRPLSAADEMEMDPFKNNSYPSATSFEPKEFKVWLKPRFADGFGDLHSKIFG
ncbi:uncharacterized protein CXQ87_003459 [Candidozyma duobushaemuli]|uniref:Cytochrome P450 n=2 Tax=Candidozyma TaxID=3303203 RepID=A0ABX8I6Z3_9ASCO|nr:uncharacterized protein CXQ87_003459 [[Candida] duobushaemulonis]PVH15613.1 hypothetical protein CXQ87_003459 [[Candida] duobushaemulonis]QWU88807.1 hypothetical protein CA3LBN_003115 [[Candida] haemuloni]